VTVALIDSKAAGLVRQRPAAPTLAVRIDGLTVADVPGLSVHDALERSANQTRSTFGSPEVRSRHGCQGAPSPGHRYGCPEASGTRSHSGVGLAEPGDINGDRCADCGHKVIGVSRAESAIRAGDDRVSCHVL